MVDMRKRQESMQGRVDRSDDRVIAEGAQRIHLHHLVFKLDTTIGLLDCEQLLHVERRKTSAPDAAEVTATPLHPKNLFGLSIQGIDLVQLRACVAATEVCDSQIRAKKIRPIPQQILSIQLRRTG